MKQTAVEWLQELELQRDLTLEDYEQAKEMEKEQLRKAYLADPYNAICGFEQYYNETYKSEEDGQKRKSHSIGGSNYSE